MALGRMDRDARALFMTKISHPHRQWKEGEQGRDDVFRTFFLYKRDAKKLFSPNIWVV